MKSVCHFFPDVDVLPINGLEARSKFLWNDNDHHHYHLIFCNYSSEWWKIHSTGLKEILRFAVLKWLKINLETTNFHWLLFIWCFLNVFSNLNFQYFWKFEKILEVQNIDQHLKVPLFHPFQEMGKIGKYSIDSNVEKKCNYSLRATFKNIDF